MNDPSLIAISAFNPNCKRFILLYIQIFHEMYTVVFLAYHQVDGNSSYVYRTNDFPGLAFMIKRSAYESFLKGKLNTCCNKRSWYNWILKNAKGETVSMDVLVPDVSRVFRRPYDISSSDFSFLNNLFNRRRKTNL